MKTLADFKRVLAEPGTVLKLLSHSRSNLRAHFFERAKAGRKIKRVYKSHFKFDDGFCVDFEKAENWVFTDNTATLNSINNATIVYEVITGQQQEQQA
jgi:hypothetical protein